MNQCNESHIPTFKIVYKGAKGSDYNPEWLVCEGCYEKNCFGPFNDMASLMKLN